MSFFYKDIAALRLNTRDSKSVKVELMTLQLFYTIKEITNNTQLEIHPDLSLLRKALFWDTDIHKINWVQQKSAVINRVFERGNDKEKSEITRFYGKQTVDKILKSQTNKQGSLNHPITNHI